ncbi:kinesin-like protein KIN-14K isoform X2 [Ipomoea triloba]|uniref:kinesin-like protein KIN-14K isoform X2 n=1 Tax=Ipomoea triloba TaxID=35885 RepID=UPI00125DB29A|nr:kinesin-like protein KIN-14K isoform X2 [Ipomoea triloba]
MNSVATPLIKDYGRLNDSNISISCRVFEPSSSSNAKHRAAVVEWINDTLHLNLPVNASDEELRAFLADGSVLCQLLNKLEPNLVIEDGGSSHSWESCSGNVGRFLSGMDKLGLSRFHPSDLGYGCMKIVVDCLLTLKTHYMPNVGAYKNLNMHISNLSGNASNIRWKEAGEHFGCGDAPQRQQSSQSHSSLSSREERQNLDSKFKRTLHTPVMADPSAASVHQVGHRFQEVFQVKQGSYADLLPTKVSEAMKSNRLGNAPTHSLLSVVNGILDESTERKNGGVPERVACLLRKVVQEIEMRISTQAEHLRMQSDLFKAREDKYQSRIRDLEAFATGTREETETIVMNPVRHIKNEKSKIQEKMKREHDMARLMKEKGDANQEIAVLKQEFEEAKKTYEQNCLQMKIETGEVQRSLEERLKEITSLEERLKEVMNHFTQSRNRVQELEEFSEAKSQQWSKIQHIYQIFTEFQLGALRELRFSSQSIRQEVSKTQKIYSEEFNHLGVKIKSLGDAAASYSVILAENRKLHNEVQELKGNIRVYCRVRPFLPKQKDKQTIVEYVGDNGELIVMNPSKQAKEGRRSFKFNKVYGPSATQGQVFADIQPLIQSVLDGYNVCIFAYGQTGSGKTYTMTGPDGATEEQWGVNYRALNDLFRISQTRGNAFSYEITVQMVEIYNEQVRDLLSSDGSHKRLGILNTSQPNGLAVPDASMFPVNKPSDVLELMNIGLKSRAKSSTSMNERSSRSHSILTIHVRGMDKKSGSSMNSSLHLVDLAGSERIDRSEVAGDRLKEAQHINKSLAALGDVISALSTKSPHVPYRNSKLTQVLQSSLGGQAKTLMFVQLNPDHVSFSESLSTLKFAERAYGVELGAAKSSKDGKDVRELMEQVTSLRETIAAKDEEIEKLQQDAKVTKV